MNQKGMMKGSMTPLEANGYGIECRFLFITEHFLDGIHIPRETGNG